jgi:ligand-binding SRPBCC domain-containing protein
MRFIAPPSLVVRKIFCEPRAKIGETFRIQACQFGLPIDWTGQWERAEEPNLLIDTAIHSPFAFWRHSHIFSPHPDGAMLTDRVEHLMGGGLAGRMISWLVLPIVFAAMFRARHEATRRHFASQ